MYKIIAIHGGGMAPGTRDDDAYYCRCDGDGDGDGDVNWDDGDEDVNWDKL